MVISVILILISLFIFSITYISGKRNERKMERLFREQIIHVGSFLNTAADFISACNTQIKLLHQLNEVLLLGRDPAIRLLYSKLKAQGPMDSSEAATRLGQEVTREMYENFNRIVNDKIENTENPIQKEKLKELLSEMADIHALYATISPDSSTDYVETISQNINEMVQKLNDLFQDMLDDGVFT